MKQYPSQARLRELFDYDPDGFLVWRNRIGIRECSNSRFVGKRAGSFGVSSGLKSFNQIRIDGTLYKASELIWIYHNGEIPEGKSVISNNSKNIKINEIVISDKNDRSGVQHSMRLIDGFVGVSLKSCHYVAKYDNEHLGTFTTAEAAAACVDSAIRIKHGCNASFNLNHKLDFEFFRVKSRTIQKKKKNNGRMIGCYYDKRKKTRQWYSKIGNKFLGTFDDQEEAARAYNIAARDHYGEQATLNDIPDPLGTGEIF